MKIFFLVMITISSLMTSFASESGECGRGNEDAVCPNGLCCSKFGWCGATEEFCGDGCQSQCEGPPPPPPPPAPPLIPDDLSSVISREQFEKMLLHRNDISCPAFGFYTYDDFLDAAKSFPSFGNSGDDDARRREVAAFFGQTAHETSGGWPDAPDGPYAWGYCKKEERNHFDIYCQQSEQWPCADGKSYFGRGPIQLTWNYNYGPCGEALGLDLLENPDLVSVDGVISFKSALWFWMTPQAPKPSPHDVIIGDWVPSSNDDSNGRVPGYGVITNIINGGVECGGGQNSASEDRVGFYKRFCEILGVSPGDNLDCEHQQPFQYGASLDAAM